MAIDDIPVTTIDDIPVTTIDGEVTTLARYAGQVRLIVNVASRCGLAPQYDKLEALQRTYGQRGFTVLGFPSNQFLQELGSEDAIKEYCSTTWGVTFPMFERVKVNGRSRHPLYAELTRTPDASGKAGRITWNFEKFLLTPDGHVHRFRPKVEPDAPEIIELIEAHLPQPGREA
ncbi:MULTISPECIES: glutathione peroxidase [Cellulomonadaceae]|uniref:Glutathione peroxidase n=2 Tax=Cellulomonadaceae TaxID=85016 RepID=A0A021VVV6_9CELL|nr:MULTISPECIES: glutathione peroxidase [Cellulomonadaceae]EYR65296.1 glutathione peroxidase [Actinotalea ferrariae CF5-4]KGM12739.1 glutathione peroxidase [Cellulomonas carbonis T26]GGC13987.1 glutathione peroxidase [Cellulomonas carbonis]